MREGGSLLDQFERHGDTASPAPGVWLAYYSDWSGFRVFADEVDALRHAVAHSMQVAYLRYGQDPHEAIQ